VLLRRWGTRETQLVPVLYGMSLEQLVEATRQYSEGSWQAAGEKPGRETLETWAADLQLLQGCTMIRDDQVRGRRPGPCRAVLRQGACCDGWGCAALLLPCRARPAPALLRCAVLCCAARHMLRSTARSTAVLCCVMPGQASVQCGAMRRMRHLTRPLPGPAAGHGANSRHVT
jgi:hypothetical protein